MISLRTATSEDVPALLEIYNQIILHTTAVYQYNVHTLEMRTEWFLQKQQAGYPVIVATEDGVVLGFATYGPFRAWEAYLHTIEHSVYVKDGLRGKGIGATLLAALVTQAEKQGYHTMIAGIDATNEGSIRLHQKQGFEQVALFKEVGWKFDRWLDLVFMQKMLGNIAGNGGQKINEQL